MTPPCRPRAARLRKNRTRTTGEDERCESSKSPKESVGSLVGCRIGKFQKKLASSKKFLRFRVKTRHVVRIDWYGKAKSFGVSPAFANFERKFRASAKFSRKGRTRGRPLHGKSTRCPVPERLCWCGGSTGLSQLPITKLCQSGWVTF